MALLPKRTGIQKIASAFTTIPLLMAMASAAPVLLWSMECQLEKKLVEPHKDNYSEVIEQARVTVKQNY